MTTKLPTEPGLYLFVGVRSSRNASQLVAQQIPEMVCVSRESKDKLRYIGRDFFYTPERALGAWDRISDDTISEIMGMADGVLLREFAVMACAELEKTWPLDNTREGLEALIESGHYHGLSVEDDSKRAKIVDMAWKAGMLEGDPYAE